MPKLCGVSWRFVYSWCMVCVFVLISGQADALFAQKNVTYTVFPAQPGAPSKAKVTLVLKDSTLAYAVRALAQQARLQLLYDTDNQAMQKRVSIAIVDMHVMDAIATTLKGTGLVARLTSNGETVVIRPQADPVAGRERVAGGIVIGHVSDSANGQGLGGAQVRVAGVSGLSTVTSDSGNFTLRDIPAGDQVINVRLFGYRPAERTVTVVDGQRTTVRIVMVAVPTVLSGVVTTATGLQSKLSVGNDITTLNVDSVMKVAPVSSVTDLLETRVPGLTVLHSSGTPGDPSRIRIRGASSINGNNDPIVVVDGVRVYASQSDPRNNNLAPSLTGGSTNSVASNTNTNGLTNTYAAPSPLDQIDPNSIETIEVFKGPSASALYGSDAANGVIVITTKRGRTGPTHWQLALGAGFVSPPGDWPVNYYRFGYGRNAGAINNPFCEWNDPTCQIDSIVPYQALNDPRYSVFADHGSNQTASLTVSGGVPTMNYSLTASSANTLGYLKLPGLEQQRYEQFYLAQAPHWMVRPDAYTNFGGSGQLTVQPNAKTAVTLISSLYNSNQQRSSLEQAVTQLEGEYINPLFLGSSPLIQNEMERATDNQLSSTNALTVRLQPVSWLPITATGGLNTIQRVDKAYIPFGVVSSSIPETIFAGADTNGNYGLGHGTSVDKTLDLNTTIPLRGVTLSVGGNYHSGAVADFQAQTNALAPGVKDPTDFPIAFCGATDTRGNGCSSFSQSSSSSATYGWFFEPRLNFGSRLFAAPGFRLDGGSASGTHGGFNGSGLTGLPKIDLSYVAVDRPTHPLWGVLSLLRPRIAFGVAGTQPDPGAKLRLFNINQQNESIITLNGSVVPSTFLDALGNTQLQPETSRELEGGFDASLWNNRLSLTVSQYNKTRHNAIISIPVAQSVNGGGDIQFNIGEVRNTGTELTVNAQVLQSRAFGWTVGGNISNDNNLLVHLNPGALEFIGGVNGNGSINNGIAIRNVPGYPLFSQWALPVVSYADADGDGIIERNEIRFGDSLVYVGQQAPKYQMNINTGVSLLNGRLSVYATFAYQNGLTQSNAAAFQSGALLSLGNAPGTTFATQAAIVAAYTASQNIDNGVVGTKLSQIGLLQTVNTFRFQTLSINYTIPKTVASLFKVPRMSVALQGSNLGLHTNYRGLDPNVNAFPSGNDTQDSGQLPEPRTWRLMFNLGN